MEGHSALGIASPFGTVSAAARQSTRDRHTLGTKSCLMSRLQELLERLYKYDIANVLFSSGFVDERQSSGRRRQIEAWEKSRS